MERVHAAVLGARICHECVLPLEMYLEENIPLVCHIRDKEYAELVELPQQSFHLVFSFSNAAASVPCLKVSHALQRVIGVSLHLPMHCGLQQATLPKA